MSLAAGTRVGAYEIVSVLGAGGMGEVYRARDARLGRDVAIKVMPDLFLRDAERLSRFEREPRTLASLNHPNIAAIYGMERVESVSPAGEPGSVGQALVMELVEGEDLAAVLMRSMLGVWPGPEASAHDRVQRALPQPPRHVVVSRSTVSGNA